MNHNEVDVLVAMLFTALAEGTFSAGTLSQLRSYVSYLLDTSKKVLLEKQLTKLLCIKKRSTGERRTHKNLCRAY